MTPMSSWGPLLMKACRGSFRLWCWGRVISEAVQEGCAAPHPLPVPRVSAVLLRPSRPMSSRWKRSPRWMRLHPRTRPSRLFLFVKLPKVRPQCRRRRFRNLFSLLARSKAVGTLTRRIVISSRGRTSMCRRICAKASASDREGSVARHAARNGFPPQLPMRAKTLPQNAPTTRRWSSESIIPTTGLF